jgi:hypothetical protein
MATMRTALRLRPNQRTFNLQKPEAGEGVAPPSQPLYQSPMALIPFIFLTRKPAPRRSLLPCEKYSL